MNKSKRLKCPVVVTAENLNELLTGSTLCFQPRKLGFTQFSHLRKRKPDDSADYICPIDSGALTVNGVSRLPSAALRGLSPLFDRQAERREPIGIKVDANGPKE